MRPGITRALTVLCWALAVPGLLWAGVRLLGLERGPLVQLLAFTPYVAAWSLVPVALSLGLRRWWPAVNGQPRATPDGPIRILAGDFNATLDHAPLRRLMDSGYRDAADAAGAGLTGTWGPYDGDRIPPVTIDHVLVDRRVGVRDVSVLRLPGSDHRPVLAELALPNGSGGGV